MWILALAVTILVMVLPGLAYIIHRHDVARFHRRAKIYLEAADDLEWHQ